MSSYNLLTINHGSSSLKYGLYDVRGNAPRELGSATIDSPGAELPLDAIRQMIAAHGGTVSGIAHRVVHGGPLLQQHCLITPSVMTQLEAAAVFAPLHTAPALAAMRSAHRAFPDVPQVACFDTQFHAAMPNVARVLPVDRALQADGIRRYGFHGLSCESIVRQLGSALPARVVIAHLGSGASVTAVAQGKSIDTTMGLTPSGGVVMGTRSGDLDPGLLIYLLRERGYDADKLERLIDHQSGLAGISGVSGDMRALQGIAAANADARLAIDIFQYSVRKGIAAMIAALGGVDALVFTGGIGEHDVATRMSICESLWWAGIRIDTTKNASGSSVINRTLSPCKIHVLPSQEDEQMAQHAQGLILAAGTH